MYSVEKFNQIYQLNMLLLLIWPSEIMLGWCFGVWAFLHFTYTCATRVAVHIYMQAYSGNTSGSGSKNINFIENKGVEKLMLVNAP